MTEGSCLAELEKLLDGLPDNAARKRVLDWATARYCKTKTGGDAVKVAAPLVSGSTGRDKPPTEPAFPPPWPLGPTVNPSAWVPPQWVKCTTQPLSAASGGTLTISAPEVHWFGDPMSRDPTAMAPP